MGNRFPSLKAQQLLAVLMRKPLEYEVTRRSGSHRTLESKHGYPRLGFAFHDGITVPPGAVRKILMDDVGLSEQEARKLL